MQVPKISNLCRLGVKLYFSHNCLVFLGILNLLNRSIKSSVFFTYDIIDKAKNIITNSTKNLEKDFKPRYDDSMLKKWYIIQDKKDYAEKTIGPSNYEEYDIIVPFSGGKWTKTSYIPLIEDIYKNYIGFQESWPELKKENHLKHYNQYLDQFLIRIGSDADLNKDDIVSKQELEELKKLYELQ